MIYAALLRGINVGGKNKMEMKKLKESFEKGGMQRVGTYINSGNVIFEDAEHSKKELAALLETAIFRDFALEIKVLVLGMDDLDRVIEALPAHWRNDDTMQCDVMFLWEEVDAETVLSDLDIKSGIDTALYVPGAVLWSVDRVNVTRSGLIKVVGTKLYGKMTVRNVNSVRKIHELMGAACDADKRE